MLIIINIIFSKLIIFLIHIAKWAIGPFVGAWAAFGLNKYESANNIKDKNKLALLQTSYVIGKIYEISKNLQELFIKTKAEANAKNFFWEYVRSYISNLYNLQEIPKQALLFLLEDETKDKEILDIVFTIENNKQELIEIHELILEEWRLYKTGQPSDFVSTEILVKTKLDGKLNRYRDKLKKLNNSLLADCQKALNTMNNLINCMKP